MYLPAFTLQDGILMGSVYDGPPDVIIRAARELGAIAFNGIQWRFVDLKLGPMESGDYAGYHWRLEFTAVDWERWTRTVQEAPERAARIQRMNLSPEAIVDIGKTLYNSGIPGEVGREICEMGAHVQELGRALRSQSG